MKDHLKENEDIHNYSQIPFARPVIGVEEEKAVLAVLRSAWLTTGREAQNFEEEFAHYLVTAQRRNDDHNIQAIALSSATAGLFLGIQALNYAEYSPAKIVLSPYTFAASINTIIQNRIEPVLVDTVPGGYHLDPDALESLLKREKSDIRAVMVVHFGGVEHEGDRIDEICRRYSIDLIEDAAHSFPGKNSLGEYQGTRGVFSSFSFYANKTITTGEGGMLVTRNNDLAQKVKVMRLHGISRDVFARYTEISNNIHAPSWQYDILQAGYKFNLPDILATIGRVQLKKANEFLKRRTVIANRYTEALISKTWCTCPFLQTEGEVADDRHSWHVYSLHLKLDSLRINRDEFMEALRAEGIGTSVHFIPLHLMTYYKKCYGFTPNDFPNALNSFLSTISLPIYPSLRDEEIDRIIKAVILIGDSNVIPLASI